MNEIFDLVWGQLRADGVDVAEFYVPDSGVDGVSCYLAIRCREDQLPNWRYFVKRLNECGEVGRANEHGGLFVITLQGGGGSAMLRRSLKRLAETIKRRYYLVAPKVPFFSVLVKPTHRCNLDCLYCYDKPFREQIQSDMTMETLDQIAKLVSQHAEKVEWIWHGGEPTVVGRNWYERAFAEVFSRYPMVDWDFNLMSNGVLLDDEWLAMFDRFGIKFGVSFNAGHQFQLRVVSQTKSLPAINSRIEGELGRKLVQWRKAGRQFGVIDVITGVNVGHQIEIYEWYNRHGIDLAMNPIFHTRNTEKNGIEVSAGEYVQEFLRYFRHWLYDTDCRINERSASNMLTLVVGGREVTCTHSDCRFKWLGFNPLGEIYPCDRWFSDKYKIGHVSEFGSVEEIFASKGYQTYAKEIQERFETRCRNCDVAAFCRGGCNATAFETTGSVAGTDPFYCQLMRGEFWGVYDILRDVDVMKDASRLNPRALSIMLNNNFYSVKEIKAYCKEQGLEFPLEYDPVSPSTCSEYQVFRGVNPVRDMAQVRKHVDVVMNAKNPEAMRKNALTRQRDLTAYLREVADYALQRS